MANGRISLLQPVGVVWSFRTRRGPPFPGRRARDGEETHARDGGGMETTTTSLADDLRARLDGSVHEPGDAAYDDTCTLFNSMISRRPAAVARCASVEDVVAV